MIKKHIKPVIGIMGAIASGKSFVSGIFAQMGCGVIDADKIAHDVLLEDEVKRQICSEFGEGCLNEAGDIDRKQTAEIVFGDPLKLEKLNSIVHPRVESKIKELMNFFDNDDDCKAIVLDVPLLVEVGWDKWCDLLVFVDCDEEDRLARMKQRGFAGVEQVKKRENFQISLDKKRKLANYIIWNNSDRSATFKQVADIITEISGDCDM